MISPKSFHTERLVRIAFLLLSALLLAGPTMAAKYYVKPTGNDANSGLTEPLAWQHVMKACSTVVAGDTVLIRAGRYDETSNLNGSAWGTPVQAGLVPTNHGTAGRYIVFKGYPGDTKPLIIGKYGTGAGYTTVATHRMGALLDAGDNYLTYDSLEFRFGPTGIFLTGGGPHDIIIRNCVIDSMLGLGGAPADDNAGGVMTYVNGYNGNLDGTRVQRNITVEGCEIFAIGAWSGSTPNYTHFYNTGGIYNYCCDSCLFRNNNIHHTAAGIEFKEPARYTEVYGNTIHDVAISMWDRFLGSGAGYGYNGPDRVMARWHNNISYHAGVCFLLGTGSVNGTLQDTLVYFYNNTCDCDSATYYGTAYGMNWPQRGGVNGQHGNYDSAFFFNNIFYKGPSTRYAACDDHDYAFGLSNCTFPISHVYEDYNMFWGLGATGAYFGRNSTSYTLAQWKAASVPGFTAGQGANTRVADPLFVNSAAHNYNLQAGSPALTGGKGGSFTFFQGTARAATVTLPTYLGALGVAGPPDSSIRVNDAPAVNEGTSVVFPVTIATTFASPCTISYHTNNGTAIAPGDYTAVPSGQLTIPAGSASGTISISTINDALTEASEAMTVTLTGATVGRIATATATGTILDNDTLSITLTANPTVVDSAGTTTLKWTSAHADSVAVSDGTTRIAGGVAAADSVVRSLTVTTTYTAVAYKLPFTDTAQVTVSVTNMPLSRIIFEQLPGDTVAVSGTYSGYTKSPITDTIIDPYRDAASTWASDQSTSPHWVEAVFGVPQAVAGVTIFWAWNNTRASWMTSQQYTIQGWNGSTFVNLATVTNSTKASSTLTTFPPTTTQRLRIYQPANQGPTDYASILWLTELRIWGPRDLIRPYAIDSLQCVP